LADQKTRRSAGFDYNWQESGCGLLQAIVEEPFDNVYDAG
jgi:hypothetical protein